MKKVLIFIGIYLTVALLMVWQVTYPISMDTQAYQTINKVSNDSSITHEQRSRLAEL